MYTDGNEFGLWRNGDLIGSIVRLIGDIEISGKKLDAPPNLLNLFEDFLRWQPIAPRDPKQLAEVSARLCRLLRDEVMEQLELNSPALTDLKTDWRKVLFPDASDAQFADGYAQAVTFGLLMARAKEIPLSTGLEQVARQLGQTNSLIGAALRLLTEDAENQATLKTSLGTLTAYWTRLIGLQLVKAIRMLGCTSMRISLQFTITTLRSKQVRCIHPGSRRGNGTVGA